MKRNYFTYMMQAVVLLCTSIVVSSMLVACSTSDNPTGNSENIDESRPLYSLLKKNSKVHKIKKMSDARGFGFKECYKFYYEQPLDHNDASKGTFRQEVVVFLRDVDAPTVVYLSDYEMSYKNRDDAWYNDLGYDLEANYVEIEHRYFGDSKIQNDTKWEYISAKQAAADQHEIINALKPLLKGWVSTGVVEPMFLTYFYPDDVDVTTVFCSPFLTSMKDDRIPKYLFKECGDGADQEHALALLNRVLKDGTDGLYAKVNDEFKAFLEEHGKTPKNFPFYMYVTCAIEVNNGLYMYYNEKERKEIWPAIDCSDEELLNFYTSGTIYAYFLEQIGTPVNEMTWEEYNPYYPYYIQATKELGEYCYDLSLLGDITNAPGFDDPMFTAEPKEQNYYGLLDADMWVYDTYDNSMMLDLLDNFLPNTDKPILFVYSTNDPWTGARPAKINNNVAKMIFNPIGVHAMYLNNPDYCPTSVRSEVLDYIGKYIKTPATARSRGEVNLPSVQPDRRKIHKHNRIPIAF